MKKVTQGLWSVGDGKGNRHYVNCDNTYTGAGEGLMHPEQVAERNGLGMYGYEHLQDLAIAILLFERKMGRGGKLKEKFDSALKPTTPDSS